MDKHDGCLLQHLRKQGLNYRLNGPEASAERKGTHTVQTDTKR